MRTHLLLFFDRTHKWGRDTRALRGNAAIEQARDDHLNKKSGFADGLFWLCFNYALVKFYWMLIIFEAARRVRRPSVRVTGIRSRTKFALARRRPCSGDDQRRWRRSRHLHFKKRQSR